MRLPVDTGHASNQEALPEALTLLEGKASAKHLTSSDQLDSYSGSNAAGHRKQWAGGAYPSENDPANEIKHRGYVTTCQFFTQCRRRCNSQTSYRRVIALVRDSRPGLLRKTGK